MVLGHTVRCIPVRMIKGKDNVMDENYNFYYYHFPDSLNSLERFVGDELMNTIALFAAVSLLLMIVVGGSITMALTTSAQEDSTSSQSQNETRNIANTEEKTYILVFAQRTVGNIDNSTKIVSSIVGNNSAKIQEEFLEEISLAPSQQLEEQINNIINDGNKWITL